MLSLLGGLTSAPEALFAPICSLAFLSCFDWFPLGLVLVLPLLLSPRMIFSEALIICFATSAWTFDFDSPFSIRFNPLLIICCISGDVFRNLSNTDKAIADSWLAPSDFSLSILFPNCSRNSLLFAVLPKTFLALDISDLIPLIKLALLS